MSSARRDGRPGYLAAAATAFLSDSHLNRDMRQGPHRLVRAADGWGRKRGGAGHEWFAQAAAGLYVLDTELRIVSAGLATQIMGGVPAERVLGRRLTDVHSLAAPSQIEAMLREVLDSGVPAPERVVRMSLRDVPGRPCWVSAFRLADQHGAVLGVAAVLADAGELEKKRARLPLFSELRARLGRTLDVVATCQDVVDALVPRSADIAVLDVVDSVIRREDPPLAPLAREVPLPPAPFRSPGGHPHLQAPPRRDPL